MARPSARGGGPGPVRARAGVTDSVSLNLERRDSDGDSDSRFKFNFGIELGSSESLSALTGSEPGTGAGGRNNRDCQTVKFDPACGGSGCHGAARNNARTARQLLPPLRCTDHSSRSRPGPARPSLPHEHRCREAMVMWSLAL